MAGTPFRNIFEGLDPLFASEVMTALGMRPEQMHDTRYPAMLAKAVRFLKGEPNWRLTVSKVLHGKMFAEPLTLLAEYADLRGDFEATRNALKEASENIDKLRFVAEPGSLEIEDAQRAMEETQKEVSALYEEVRIYEK